VWSLRPDSDRHRQPRLRRHLLLPIRRPFQRDHPLLHRHKSRLPTRQPRHHRFRFRRQRRCLLPPSQWRHLQFPTAIPFRLFKAHRPPALKTLLWHLPRLSQVSSPHPPRHSPSRLLRNLLRQRLPLKPRFFHLSRDLLSHQPSRSLPKNPSRQASAASNCSASSHPRSNAPGAPPQPLPPADL